MPRRPEYIAQEQAFIARHIARNPERAATRARVGSVEPATTYGSAPAIMTTERNLP